MRMRCMRRLTWRMPRWNAWPTSEITHEGSKRRRSLRVEVCRSSSFALVSYCVRHLCARHLLRSSPFALVIFALVIPAKAGIHGCRRSAPPHHVVSPFARLTVMPRGTRRDASVHRRELPVALTRLCATLHRTGIVLANTTTPDCRHATRQRNPAPVVGRAIHGHQRRDAAHPWAAERDSVDGSECLTEGEWIWASVARARCKCKSWIPAFAGMTARWRTVRSRAPLFIPGDATCRSWTGASPARGQ